MMSLFSVPLWHFQYRETCSVLKFQMNISDRTNVMDVQRMTCYIVKCKTLNMRLTISVIDM